MRIDDLTWVAGGREFNDLDRIARGYELLPPETILITGAARGADLTAENLWRNKQLPYIGVPAEWRKYNRRAGYIRNAEIAKIWKPARLLVLPGGRGTASSIKLAEEMEIEVIYA